jgi:hypothetical protein
MSSHLESSTTRCPVVLHALVAHYYKSLYSASPLRAEEGVEVLLDDHAVEFDIGLVSARCEIYKIDYDCASAGKV